MSILKEIAKQIRAVDDKLSLFQSSRTLLGLIDVTPQPQNLGVLQYNSLSGMWTAEAPETINAVIDGGVASTIHLEILDIDGGGA